MVKRIVNGRGHQTEHHPRSKQERLLRRGTSGLLGVQPFAGASGEEHQSRCHDQRCQPAHKRLSVNDAAQWRAAESATNSRETQSARPLEQPS